jgi:arginyl-tRNA synthetase
MVLAKQLRSNPRQVAQQIIDKLDLTGLCAPPEIAGAGFINFRLDAEWLNRRFSELAGEPQLGVGAPVRPKKFVIDFSSPNVAKPMHVGHIRSTILGDSLARIAEFAGHEVVRDNHIGDWGTQFGMLLVGWKSELDAVALRADPLGEMERIYKLISARCKEDPAALEAARQELVKLQSGDEENLGLWREMIRLSQAQFDSIYGRLGVRFDVTLGESFYNPQLKPLIEEPAQPRPRHRERRSALRLLGWLRQTRGRSFPDQRPGRLAPKPRARPEARRRGELHDHRSRHAPASDARMAAGRNHLRHRWPSAAALPAALRALPAVAAGTRRKCPPRARLVWFHPW